MITIHLPVKKKFWHGFQILYIRKMCDYGNAKRQ